MLSTVREWEVGSRSLSCPPSLQLHSWLHPPQGRFYFWVIYPNFIALYTVSDCLWKIMATWVEGRRWPLEGQKA